MNINNEILQIPDNVINIVTNMIKETTDCTDIEIADLFESMSTEDILNSMKNITVDDVKEKIDLLQNSDFIDTLDIDFDIDINTDEIDNVIKNLNIDTSIDMINKFRNKFLNDECIDIFEISLIDGPLKQCCICIEHNSDIITTCEHQFCKSCLIKWLKYNNSCPYCRNNINLMECKRIVIQEKVD